MQYVRTEKPTVSNLCIFSLSPLHPPSPPLDFCFNFPLGVHTCGSISWAKHHITTVKFCDSMHSLSLSLSVCFSLPDTYIVWLPLLGEKLLENRFVLYRCFESTMICLDMCKHFCYVSIFPLCPSLATFTGGSLCRANKPSPPPQNTHQCVARMHHPQPRSNRRTLFGPPNHKKPDAQIRVVNAFRQGLDARYGGAAGCVGEHSNTTLAEVLRKQTSLSKRLSQTSSIEYADNIPDELTVPEIDVERLSSHSHTETAV